MISDFWDMLY